MFQAEIVKRLNGICAQVLPYLSQEVSPNSGAGTRNLLPLPAASAGAPGQGFPSRPP